MTFEETLSRLAMNTGRIADALEALASSQGIVAEPPGEEEEETKPAAKKTGKKKASKKKASKKKTNKQKVGKEKDDDDDDGAELTLKDDVRPIMKRLKAEVSHAAVKSILRKFNASTLQQLKEKDYARVIAAAEAELDE